MLMSHKVIGVFEQLMAVVQDTGIDSFKSPEKIPIYKR